MAYSVSASGLDIFRLLAEVDRGWGKDHRAHSNSCRHLGLAPARSPKLRTKSAAVRCSKRVQTPSTTSLPLPLTVPVPPPLSLPLPLPLLLPLPRPLSLHLNTKHTLTSSSSSMCQTFYHSRALGLYRPILPLSNSTCLGLEGAKPCVQKSE